MNRYKVKCKFLDEESETSEVASSPEEAAAKHIGDLPFEDGLDYPDDFWDVVVPIAEGENTIQLKRNNNLNEWSWPKGVLLKWPMEVIVSIE